MHLHWQGKLRGLEFTPRPFRFEIVGSPDILDVKGRQVQLPVMRPTTQADDEARQGVETNLDAALLRAMATNAAGSQSEWAEVIGVKHKGSVNKRLQRLKTEKLVENVLGKWVVTAKGKKALLPAEK